MVYVLHDVKEKYLIIGAFTLLLPAANLTRLAAGSSIGLTNT